MQVLRTIAQASSENQTAYSVIHNEQFPLAPSQLATGAYRRQLT
jgi:hypothetical protein